MARRARWKTALMDKLRSDPQARERLRDKAAQLRAQEATTMATNNQPALQPPEPCPWCGKASDERDEWGYLITHKPTCYWLNIHGDPIGRVRVNFSEVEQWNTRARVDGGVATVDAPLLPQTDYKTKPQLDSKERYKFGHLFHEYTFNNCDHGEQAGRVCKGCVVECLAYLARRRAVTAPIAASGDERKD